MTCFSCATPHRHHLLLPPSTSKSLLRFHSSYLKPSPSLLFHGSSRSVLSCSDGSNNGPPPSGDTVPKQVLPLILLLFMNSINFCIIEGSETVQDFVQMQLQEIQDSIRSRRNKIFLLMEEVRRLRVQQRIKSVKAINEDSELEATEMPEITSSIPFLPNVTPKTLKQLYSTSVALISGIIFFGGLIAPNLELKVGLGGTSYEDFIRSLHLPLQLSQVDPIVASFSGGAVGVISTLMLIEVNNVKQQEKKRCKYCLGTGYLPCARCSASGVCLSIDPITRPRASNRLMPVATTKRCLNCSGAGKVMCPTCLCTGMVTASEHDPRFDPFD
ncbi:unnamed protein product [Arabidopsis halleri]